MVGDDEWQLRKHGPSRRRQWRKMHLAIDAESAEVRAAGLTSSSGGDSPALPDLLAQSRPDQPIGTVAADGAGHTRNCPTAMTLVNRSPALRKARIVLGT